MVVVCFAVAVITISKGAIMKTLLPCGCATNTCIPFVYMPMVVALTTIVSTAQGRLLRMPSTGEDFSKIQILDDHES